MYRESTTTNLIIHITNLSKFNTGIIAHEYDGVKALRSSSQRGTVQIYQTPIIEAIKPVFLRIRRD